MQNNFIQILPWAKYLLGLIIYFILVSNQQLSMAIIWLLFVVYGWTIVSILIKTYNLQTFVYVLCCSGIIVSVSLFFMQGVEQLPFPEGAIQFKSDGIARALVLFFVFTMPLIIGSQKTVTENYNINPNKKPQQAKQNPPKRKIPQKNNWEEASLEDIESGKYEPV